MLELIFGAMERRCEIEHAIHRQDLHPWVLPHGGRQIVAGVGDLLRSARRLMGQVPVVTDPSIIVGPIGERRLVTEIAEQIVVQSAVECAGYRGPLRIVVGSFADIVRFCAEVARVDSPDHLVAVAQ